MGVSYSENIILFRGVLTQDEINQIVKKGAVKILQTDTMPLDVPTLQKLNDEYFEKFPDTELRIYSYADCDLSPLAVMNKIKKLSIESSSTFLNIETIYSLNAIRHLRVHTHRLPDNDFLIKIPNLIETLEIDITNKSFDLKSLSRFECLETLGLYKCKKNIEIVSDLKQLRCLKLHGITLPSYSFVNKLPNLKTIAFSRGNIEKFSELYDNNTITGLYLFHLPKINNLDILERLPNLQVAEICQLTNVEKLPDLSKSKLQHLCFENMKNLFDFTSIGSAQHLKSVSETVCPTSLEIDNILPIIQNLNIEQCAFYTSSSRKNELFAKLIEQHKKKCEANTHIVRKILFPNGKM